MNDFHSRLARLDSCVASDALDKLGLTGVVAGLTRLSTDGKLAGSVLTVRLERADGRLAERHLCTAAIEAAVDRVSLERHELAKRAKDIGSAAVLVALVNVPVVWLLVLFG